MNLNDAINIIKDKDIEVVVNVAGFLLPIENIRIVNNQAVVIISASALEDREIPPYFYE
jgi:hypothetical protein